VATRQYDTQVIPRESLARRLDQVPETIDDGYHDWSYWDGYSLGDLALAFDCLLGRGPSGPDGRHQWRTDESDRIEVYSHDSRVDAVFVRFDLRDLSMPLLQGITELARSQDWVFVAAENLRVIPPNVADLLRRSRASHAAQFVANPDGLLVAFAPVMHHHRSTPAVAARAAAPRREKRRARSPVRVWIIVPDSTILRARDTPCASFSSSPRSPPH